MKTTIFMLAALAKYSQQATMNSTAIDAMIRDSCHGDEMCVALLNELDMFRSVGDTSSDRSMFLRRLKQLKSLVLHLQPEHRFARYCFYGCWCLPDAGHKIHSPGYGTPMDPVDASCKRQSQCYDCAKLDHPGRDCVADKIQYKYTLNYDAADPTNHWKKSITCDDDPMTGKNGGKSEKASCRRAICECDKALAEDLRENFEYWQVGHHATQGNFVPTAECFRDQSPGPGSEGPPQCCGSSYATRFSYKTMNGQRGCCGDKTYDSTIQECCNEETSHISATGSC